MALFQVWCKDTPLTVVSFLSTLIANSYLQPSRKTPQRTKSKTVQPWQQGMLRPPRPETNMPRSIAGTKQYNDTRPRHKSNHDLLHIAGKLRLTGASTAGTTMLAARTNEQRTTDTTRQALLNPQCMTKTRCRNERKQAEIVLATTCKNDILEVLGAVVVILTNTLVLPYESTTVAKDIFYSLRAGTTGTTKGGKHSPACCRPRRQ